MIFTLNDSLFSFVTCWCNFWSRISAFTMSSILTMISSSVLTMISSSVLTMISCHILQVLKDQIAFRICGGLSCCTKLLSMLHDENVIHMYPKYVCFITRQHSYSNQWSSSLLILSSWYQLEVGGDMLCLWNCLLTLDWLFQDVCQCVSRHTTGLQVLLWEQPLSSLQQPHRLPNRPAGDKTYCKYTVT